MEEVKTRINTCLNISKEITLTAKDVNKKSHERKAISHESIQSIDSLIIKNEEMISSFERVLSNLQDSQKVISANYEGITSNKDILSSIGESLSSVSGDLSQMEKEIDKLTNIVDIIKGDTNKIFSLALNASIVSSKYSNTSGVFDILANKLNEMSNFINQNLETIVSVVSPITEGVQKLFRATENVLNELKQGGDSLDELSEILNKQVESIDELLKQAKNSTTMVNEQKDLFNEVNNMVIKMDNDAQSAIQGSGSNIDLAQTLQELVSNFLGIEKYDDNFIADMEMLRDKSTVIRETAEGVNAKSRNQFDFSENCKKFNQNILRGSVDLQEISGMMSVKTADHNKDSAEITLNLERFNTQLTEIEHNIQNSGRTIQKFNDDYKQIDNILEFLKNILKSMHLIGMYSRIESARDTEEFAGFMNISSNITSLQKEIQNNIPVIEKNITATHELIDSVSDSFKRVSDDFGKISTSSSKIISQLKMLVNLYSETEGLSQSGLSYSKAITGALENLDIQLSNLIEVVKFPIEGSDLNVKRGKNLESLCSEIMQIINNEIKKSEENVAEESTSVG